MNPKSIGIIGGAGPAAGTYMLERIFSIARKKYGCHKDVDFPKIFLISFPFSEMLAPEANIPAIQSELRECLRLLRGNGASILAIACNTLHAFLDATDDKGDLVHLPKIASSVETAPDTKPIVLCTSTSAQFGLHKRFFPCEYPQHATQKQIDSIIERILKWGDTNQILCELGYLIQKQESSAVVLGCTELSLFARRLSCANKLIIDPIELAAKEIVKQSFNN